MSAVCCQQRKHAYRDRAAERRILHGGFGGGPGQKSMVAGDFGNQISASTREEAAAEALDMSLGAGSYARRILKGMGWKEVNLIRTWGFIYSVKDIYILNKIRMLLSHVLSKNLGFLYSVKDIKTG